jgi:uncharacterized iron-regulated membrane protein
MVQAWRRIRAHRGRRHDLVKHPCLVLHRWTGLLIALFIVVCSATGALLAFYNPLYNATAPWRIVEDSSPLLTPTALIEAAERAAPEAFFNRLVLDIEPGNAVIFYPGSVNRDELDYNEIAIDPHTGREVYRGVWGDISEGGHQLMPFIFNLHYTLAAGTLGATWLGIVAMIWTLNCLLGLWLTFPRLRVGWWRFWRRSWCLPRGFSLSLTWNFHFHRAFGLWAWLLLLVFALSSVGFNYREVYLAVMKSFGGSDVFSVLPDTAGERNPQHDWTALLDEARRLATEHGATHGYQVKKESALNYRSSNNIYEYRFLADTDLPTDRPQSRLFFSAANGEVVAYKSGRGNFSADGINEWLVALHITSIGGTPYRVLIFCFGLLTCWLSSTGVMVWWQKRRIKAVKRERSKDGSLVRQRLNRFF